jgi:hypothetical protein
MSDWQRRERRSRQRTGRPHALALLPAPAANATPAVRLGLRLRREASLTGACACGAVATDFEITTDGMKPAATIRPGGVYVRAVAHEPDCPAVSPELERAAQRGEIQ